MQHHAAAGDPRPAPASAPARDGLMVSAWVTNLRFRWDTATRGARTRQFAKDETLFLEGQSADTVFAIVDGRVRLTCFGFDGKERHLMIIGRNGLVGDCGLLSSRNYVVSAVAAAEVEVCAVPMADMVASLAQDPLLLRQHQEFSSVRFRILLRQLAMHGSNSGRRRVCLHLLDLVNSYGAPHRDGSVISIAFTQQEMGSICGLSRVSVSHVFTALEREHVIARAGRLVVVQDAARLEQLSKT